jgi:hypothetical protein
MTVAGPTRVVLWAHPRSVSTAFERVFLERSDTTVFHEPFSYPFFFGEERGHWRFAGENARPGNRFCDIESQLLADVATPIVFIKDMAFHLRGRMRVGLLRRFANTFIIRNPEAALRSLHRKLPDFDLVEAGYAEMVELFSLVVEQLGQPAIVVDADDLQRHPRAFVQRYCQALGIPLIEEALRWEKREVPQWRSWDGWHDEALASTGIQPPRPPTEPGPLTERVSAMIEICRPYYDQLWRQRLQLT